MKTKKEILDWIDKIKPEKISFIIPRLLHMCKTAFFDQDYFIDMFIGWLLKEKALSRKDSANVYMAVICTTKTKSYDIFETEKKATKKRINGKIYLLNLVKIKKANACRFLLDLQGFLYNNERREMTFAEITKAEKKFKNSLRGPKTRYRRM
jgi:hypothetical protein